MQLQFDRTWILWGAQVPHRVVWDDQRSI